MKNKKDASKIFLILGSVALMIITVGFVVVLLLQKEGVFVKNRASKQSDNKDVKVDIQQPNQNTKTLRQNKKDYTPAEYQNILGVGIDVDWAKTKKGREFYNKQTAIDFKNRGFSHVRIRVKDLATEDLLKHLTRAVDDALDVGLVPIIAYQANDFKNNPNKLEAQRVVDWWEMVAKKFRNYPPEVSFDILIESTDALNKQPAVLNELYENVVVKVRQSNPKRIIFISPIVRSAPENLKLLKIPSKNNGRIMAEWHFYASGPDKTNPKKQWTIGTEKEKELIRQKIKIAKNWEEKTGLKTWVGAWMPGNYNKGDDYSVVEQVGFAKFVSGELRKNKIPFAINSDTKFYDYQKHQWFVDKQPVLDAIFK